MSAPIVRQDGANPFDAIRQVRPDGSEFWSARELSKLVEYETWRNFAAAIDRAKLACENSGGQFDDEFVQVSQVVDAGNLGVQNREDFELSRYACYLVVMNGDPRKPAIASAQSYFAIRTRQAEVVESTLADAAGLATVQLAMLQAASGLVDAKHLSAKAQLVIARGLGEAPALDPSTRPLYAQTYLEERGMTKDQIKSASPMFGKRIKAAYVMEHGEDPQQYPLETKAGQIRNVNAYTESDRPLFDAVWNRFYGGAA